MKTDIWMPLYIGDYLKDTMHLGRESHGSYLLLLMAYWNNRGPIPDDDDWLSAAAKCSLPEWTQTERKRLCKFFAIGDGVWKHARVEAELLKAQKTSQARSEAAKLANEAKSRKRHANGVQTESNGSANGSQNTPPSPSQSHIKPIEREVEFPDGFPKSEAEAEIHASFVGCTAEFAAQVWNKAAGRGGCDAKDVPIRSWRHHLRTEWTYEQGRKGESKGQGSNRKASSVWELTQSLNVTEEKITAIKRRGHEDAFGLHITEADKPEYKRLCEERKRLKDLIQKAATQN